MIAARKKLGDAVVEQYAVYNHDAFQNTVRVGRTPTGVELWFNRGFMECDLKIGIGCITAHLHVGFGGGAKLIMPGVAGIETVVQFHNQMYAIRRAPVWASSTTTSCGRSATRPATRSASTSKWIV